MTLSFVRMISSQVTGRKSINGLLHSKRTAKIDKKRNPGLVRLVRRMCERLEDLPLRIYKRYLLFPCTLNILCRGRFTSLPVQMTACPLIEDFLYASALFIVYINHEVLPFSHQHGRCKVDQKGILWFEWIVSHMIVPKSRNLNCCLLEYLDMIILNK